MASDPTASCSCHRRTNDVSRGTSQWLMRWHSLTSTTHLVRRELQWKRRQTRKSQIHSNSADLCFSSNCRGNHGSHQQRRTWIPWRPGRAHYTSHRRYLRVSLPVPAPVISYSALQCSRHPGHLRPHNLWGGILGRSSLFVFNPRDLYYGGYKI